MTPFTGVVGHLARALAGPLPGAEAHERMTPVPRREWPAGFDHAHIRHAAGLLLVFPIHDRAHLLLTVRADRLRHGGQVSLPGGVMEPGETVAQAALREAHEEVALSSAEVRVLGALTPVDIPVSGFRLHPVVGAIDRRPALTPADGEVARILEVAIDELADPAAWTAAVREREGGRVMTPLFRVAGHDIWGATAMVLSEFLRLLEQPS